MAKVSKRTERNAQLEALYAQVPTINCQGKCWTSCSIISMGPHERQRIQERGVKITKPRDIDIAVEHTCEALEGHRCGVYEQRPMICRVWGVSDGLPCPYGCVPDGVLSRDEAMLLIELASNVGGGDFMKSAAELRAQLEASRHDPRIREALDDIRDRGIEGDLAKASRHNPNELGQAQMQHSPLFSQTPKDQASAKKAANPSNAKRQ